MIDIINEILYLAGSISHDEYMNNILLNEMKMSDAGKQLLSTELWKAIQQIMEKATENKTSQNKYVIPTKTFIKVKTKNKNRYFPLCIITGEYDTQKPNSIESQICGGLKHFSAHFSNIKRMDGKNYRGLTKKTSKAAFDSFCLSTRELNNILKDPVRRQTEVKYGSIKKGKLYVAIIEPTIQYGGSQLTFRFIICLPINKGEIAYVHTCYPLDTNTFDNKKKNKNNNGFLKSTGGV